MAEPPPAQAAEAGSPALSIRLADALAGMRIESGWRFQPGDNPAWSSPGHDDSAWRQVDFPHRWGPADADPGARYFGWYRLHLRLEDRGRAGDLEHLAVRLGSMLSAYEFYAGGKRLGGAGRLPPDDRPGIDYNRERVLTIPASAIAPDGSLVLALRVWAGNESLLQHFGGGVHGGQFQIGRLSDQLLSLTVHQMPALLVSVIYLAFGFYFLYLYTRARDLHSFLWFGVAALMIGLYGLLVTEWRYLLDWNFPTYKKAELGLVYLLPALSIQGVWTMLDEPVGRWLRAYQVISVLLAVVLVLAPGLDLNVSTLHAWELWALLAPLGVLWLLVRKLRAGHEEARTLVVGAGLFIATCVHDALIDLIRLDSPRILPWGFLAIAVTMAISLGNRFTRMLNHLEEEVAERTARLTEANHRLFEAARIDPLTGVNNRRGFFAAAESEVGRAFRGGRPFSVVLADVDHFKPVNDRLGHACGDHVLTCLAGILRQAVRKSDLVARWGGEEFILLLPETDAEGAVLLAEKIRRQIAGSTIDYGDASLQLTMTFGVAEHRRGESLDSCVSRSDEALYRGKREGRNRVVAASHIEIAPDQVSASET
ncbi:sensor domain-containing diguanylate cyclase [Parahaliea mediterranea]|uniref:diguanylate cyclase n=1 Tax=Parahaliea mediterranea TaxID=651086 RepID=A0A939DDY6_9GAMM|nr:GGDEF domain-containing protein [Parahaliea mediterranea]MBN7796121.1 diguanylate cyclase [Parahaliea mediterranea]